MDKFVEEIEDEEFDHTLQSERHEELIEALGKLTSAVKENRANEIQVILKQNQTNLEKLFSMIPKAEKNDDITKLAQSIKESLYRIEKTLDRKREYSLKLNRSKIGLLEGGTLKEV